MKYINEMRESDRLKDIYLCKSCQSAQTKNGKTYWNVTLQDKTGAVNAKVWDPDSPGIAEFEAGDYIWVTGEVVVFNNANQVNIRQARKAAEGEYAPGDYVPCTDKDIDEMYASLMKLVESVHAPYMKSLLLHYFGDPDFKKRFCFHSAAKSVHHGFVGGLLEHTLSVAETCDFFSRHYDYLDRDLLLTAAILHDIGKLHEISPYPENDYTDEGQLLGHIMIGAHEISNTIDTIEGFPKVKRDELLHCILAHHGELEFGSPKKPALAEAIALSFADNTDAKLETMKEALNNNSGPYGIQWQGFNKFLDSNIRRTSNEKE